MGLNKQRRLQRHTLFVDYTLTEEKDSLYDENGEYYNAVPRGATLPGYGRASTLPRRGLFQFDGAGDSRPVEDQTDMPGTFPSPTSEVAGPTTNDSHEFGPSKQVPRLSVAHPQALPQTSLEIHDRPLNTSQHSSTDRDSNSRGPQPLVSPISITSEVGTQAQVHTPPSVGSGESHDSSHITPPHSVSIQESPRRNFDLREEAESQYSPGAILPPASPRDVQVQDPEKSTAVAIPPSIVGPDQASRRNSSFDAAYQAPSHPDSVILDGANISSAPSIMAGSGSPKSLPILDRILTLLERHRLETASGGRWTETDAFDSFEWDPELPEGSPADKSPSPVAVKPQPVAYTTVGSLVNPNALPQFTAPHRIQREGANLRRPLLSAMPGQNQGRPHDGFPQMSSRPPPALNMANSMQYAQSIAARSPNYHADSPNFESATLPESTYNYDHASPLDKARPFEFPSTFEFGHSTSHSSRNRIPELTEEVVSRRDSFRESELRSNNIGGRSTPASSFKDVQNISVAEMLDADRDGRTRSNSARQIVQGLENMQTLQRLAKFENPLQQQAIRRLEAFSLENSRPASATTVVNPAGNSPTETPSDSRTQDIERARSPPAFSSGFQFPPPGLTTSAHASTQRNPLFGAHVPNTVSASAVPNRVPPGYPQPLNAGPPGQRKYLGSQQLGTAAFGASSAAGNGQTNAGQSFSGQASNVQVSNTQPYGGQYFNGQAFNGQAFNGQAFSTRAFNEQAGSGQASGGRSFFEQLYSRQASNGRTYNGHASSTQATYTGPQAGDSAFGPSSGPNNYSSVPTSADNRASHAPAPIYYGSNIYAPGYTPWNPPVAGSPINILGWSDETSGAFGHAKRGFCLSDIVDTKPLADIAKYYCNEKGFPNDWKYDAAAAARGPPTGAVRPVGGPLSDENNPSWNVYRELLRTPETAEARKERKDDEWHSTADAMFQTFEQSVQFQEEKKKYEEQKKANPLGPIGPPPKAPRRNLKPITIEEMNAMPLSEAAKPLLQATFSRLLEANIKGPGSSYREMSRFQTMPDKYLDTSKEGNHSVFGEDWGSPLGEGPNTWVKDQLEADKQMKEHKRQNQK